MKLFYYSPGRFAEDERVRFMLSTAKTNKDPDRNCMRPTNRKTSIETPSFSVKFMFAVNARARSS